MEKIAFEFLSLALIYIDAKWLEILVEDFVKVFIIYKLQMEKIEKMNEGTKQATELFICAARALPTGN